MIKNGNKIEFLPVLQLKLMTGDDAIGFFEGFMGGYPYDYLQCAHFALLND